MNDPSKERQEKVKHYQKMTAFYEGKKQELEARVADVQAIKVEAATARDCKHWDSCDSPVCPLDQKTMERGCWCPDENICASCTHRAGL